MTPERADSFAKQAIQGWDVKSEHLALRAIIVCSIMKACAEEREACAKMMDEAADDVAEWGAYAPAYFQDKWNLQKAIKKWKDRAAAIRGGA